MKEYQYILFDWDGSLARTLDIWLAALKTPLEKRGHLFSDKQVGANFTAFRERMAALGVTDIDAILAEAQVITEHEVPNVELYPDVLATLQALHRSGKKLGLVTTSQHYQIDALLKKYHLQALLDAVICGDDVTHHKPHPQSIEQALKQLGGTRDQAIMVGDSGSDIAAANNAGVDSVLFFPPTHATFYDKEALNKLHPTYTIESLHDLLHIVL
jgi:pyrophosphatase PpaX